MTNEQTRMQERYSENIERLERYSKHYDDGNYSEAIALSTVIVKLIGDRYSDDGKPRLNSISITTKLGCKPEQMVDLSYKSMLARLSNTFGPICGMGFLMWGTQGLAPILDGLGLKHGGQY